LQIAISGGLSELGWDFDGRLGPLFFHAGEKRCVIFVATGLPTVFPAGVLSVI
jgi:hypothetical protein